MKPPTNTSRFATTGRKTFSTGSRGLTLLLIVVALGSLIFLSSVFAQRSNTRTSGYTGPDLLKRSALVLDRSNQNSALSSGAMRVDVKPVKPKIFHSDVRTVPLVMPQIKKPRR